MSISQIICKDCKQPFYYGDHAAKTDRMAGRSIPERCGKCRYFHRREYSTLGMSHAEVFQLRTDGHGGLSQYIRERKPPVEINTQTTDREPLPINGIMEDLLCNLLASPKRVHLVVGPTGSGKSTWLPFKLVRCPKLVQKGAICVTQPRIPATEGPSAYIGELYYGNIKPSVGPGLVVGYRHSNVGTSMTDSANRLIFMTDGTLLNEIKSGEVGKYSVVMIDEAHERSVNIDTILSLLKHSLPQFPELRVIIASATVDAETFIRFFGGPDKVERYLSDGFTYPILEVFSDEVRTYWPGGVIPENKGSLTWQKLSQEMIDKNWLGPSPCFSSDLIPDFRLRYYPHFETLIFHGQMTENEKNNLERASDNANWRQAVSDLYSESLQQRKIGEAKDAPISASIRGQLPRQKKPQLYTSVDQNVKNRLVYAAADAICRLVKRDEREAERRLERWKRREAYDWPKLEQPRSVGHILAFFPTTATLEKCGEILKKMLPDLPGKNQVFLYHSELSEDEKEHVTKKDAAGIGFRRIILGTNLAETSLTLDGLVYVVDTGLITEPYYNPDIKGLDYPTILHSYAGCRQRLGRVGRKEPGEGYRLYTRKELKDHPPYSTPEVTRSDPAQLILNLVSAGLPPSFVHQPGALMQPPDQNWIATALTDLHNLGAIDREGDLTSRGREIMGIKEKNLFNALLLCEADRFGCLWEMAIFLCFMRLPDKPGPDGQAKWLSLWIPDSRGVYEDQLEEKLFEENPEEENAHSTSEKKVWDDPYITANTLIRQQALRRGVLDDLELYLRIWQGWMGQGDSPEKKAAWAFDHGISAEALFRVERSLGLDRKDTSETGLLRHFWAFDQKGIMKRDIHFEVLDKVRYLYAAANQQKIFKVEGEEIQPHSGQKRGQDVEIRFESESVWSSPELFRPMRFDKPAQRGYFIANAKIKPRKKKNLQVLRHVVWMDPQWTGDKLPSLFDDPVVLAKRFSDFSKAYVIHRGRWPFARGEQLCGFEWPMPGVSVPTEIEITQWRVRYSEAFGVNARYKAVVRHIVDWPKNIKKIALVQLPGGPLLPLVSDNPLPVAGEEIEVTIRMDDQTPWPWTHPVKSISMEDAVQNMKGDRHTMEKSEERIIPKTNDTGLKSNASMPPSPPPSKVIPLPAAKPVDLQKQFPANTIVEVEFVRYAAGDGNARWVTVSIPISENAKKNWDFPVFREYEKKQFEDASAGKRCRVAINQWMMDKKTGHSKPRLIFKGWV